MTRIPPAHLTPGRGRGQEAIERIQEKQKEALDELGSKYYEELGEREITRKHGDPACTPERYIPATAAELQEMNAARLQELKDGAEQTLKAKVRYFRSMVARLTTAMSRVPTAVFLNINERAKRRRSVDPPACVRAEGGSC